MISISRCRFFSSFSDRPTLGMNFNATTFQSRQSWDQTKFPPTLSETVLNPNGTQLFQLSTRNNMFFHWLPWSWGSPQALAHRYRCSQYFAHWCLKQRNVISEHRQN